MFSNVRYQYNICDIVCVIDFEATCENYGGRRAPEDAIQEIIEFPAFIVDTKNKSLISTFHEYVKPQINPRLSSFCTRLTGITQRMVENADHFPEVLKRFEKRVNTLLNERDFRSFAIATDGIIQISISKAVFSDFALVAQIAVSIKGGILERIPPWDIAHFLARQCETNGIPFPEYAKRWINVKKLFANHYKTNYVSLDVMLRFVGIEFEGRRHSGYYDALHITKLLLRLLMDGAIPSVNEMVSWESADRKRWGNLKCGYIPCDPIFKAYYL